MSELRQDLTSGDWVIIAPGRASRPLSIKEKRAKRKSSPKSTCPFDNLEEHGNWPPLFAYPSAAKRSWQIVLIKNKYPALSHEGNTCATPFTHGMYRGKTGVGMHDLIITRDHKKNFAGISEEAAFRVLRFFQAYYQLAMKDPCNEYALPFMNWGPSAGASITHPHYQLLALPAVPPHIARSLVAAKRYSKKHHTCIRCAIIATERRMKERVIEENGGAIAIAPYASKLPFEVQIFPKAHLPYFRTSPPSVIRDTNLLIRSVMKRIKKHLNDPDLNFFIHDAPLKNGPYPYHHWHAEIFPRVSTAAGFEFSTDVYINTTTPEDATRILRGGFSK